MGSVPKETIAGSGTMSISVQNRHSRILLKDLLRGRMWEVHREPEVLEAEAQVEECLDCCAMITSKELAPLYSVNDGILQNAWSTSPKMDAGLEKSALIAWLRNSPAKGLKRMVTKVQWLCWKITRQFGCVFQDMEPPKSSSILRKSSNIRKPIRCVRFTKAVVRHANIRDENPSLGMDFSRWTSWAQPQRSKIWGSVSRRGGMARAMYPRSRMEVGPNFPKIQGENETTFFSPSENRCLPASALKPEERELVVDSGASMHMISKKDLNSVWIGNRDDIEKSDDGYNSQWRSADAWRGHSLRQRTGNILDNESPRGYASRFIAVRALWWTRILIRVDQRSKTTSH